MSDKSREGGEREGAVTSCRRFSASAPTYHRSVDVQRQVAARVLAALPRKPAAEHILELGCGTGLLTVGLLKRYRLAHVLALDAAPAMIEEARGRIGRTRRVEWRVQDARELVTPRRYDLVVSSSALHWMIPLGRVFAGARNALAPGGRFVFGMMVAGTLDELRKTRARVAPDKALRATLPEPPSVVRSLRRSGFGLVSMKTERIEMVYPEAKTFLRRLHDQGVTGGAYSAGKRPLTAGELVQLCADYDARFSAAGGGVRATYEVLYVTAEGA
ncbi:MAG: methyltransferase domain-containing protein [Pirellulaceae bacterium]